MYVNLNDRTSYTPSIRRLAPWHLRCIDGESRPHRAVEYATRQQSPPRFYYSHHGRSSAAGETERRNGKEERQRKSYNNDHSLSRWNVWRRRKDDDDDSGHHGRGDRGRRAHDALKGMGGESGREHDRSPRRQTLCGGSSCGERQCNTTHHQPGNTRPHQLSLFGPTHDVRVVEMQFLFTNHASTMKEAAANYLCRKSGNAKLDDNTPQLPNLHDYIDKAINLTNALRLPYEGDEAWSGECGKDRFSLPTVKAKVFDRIKADLSSSYNLEYSLLPSSSPEPAAHTPSCLPLIDLVPQ